MRRSRILSAISDLCDALEATRVCELLRAIKTGEAAGENRAREILLAHAEFMRHYDSFDDLQKGFVAALGLSPLSAADFWSALLEGGQSAAGNLLSGVEAAALNAISIMPKLRALLARETDTDELIVADARGAGQKIKCLRILIADDRRPLTSPAKIANVFRAMDKLYEIFSALYGKEATGLAVGSIDSGSEKAFDFFGMHIIIDEISRLLLDVWNRVKYSDENNFGYQIEHAMVSTGFALRVKKLLGDEEHAQGAVMNVAKCIETLFRSGAYTEEMDEPRDVRASIKLGTRDFSMRFEAVETAAEESRGSEKASPQSGSQPSQHSVAGLVPAIAVMLSKTSG
jgi:hypothetical protein